MVTVDSAIESFYGAALMPDHWPKALDELATALGSRGVTLVFKSTTLNTIAVSGSIQPFVACYMSSPIKDPREDRVNPTMHDDFMPDQAYFSSAEMSRDPYYQEFLAPREFGWNAVAKLNSNLFVSVKRGFSQPSYEGAGLQMLNRVLPRLRSASRTACLTWKAGFSGQLSVFERLNRGAMLIDRDARVLERNACASFGDGLDSSGEGLRATHPAGRVPLRRFLSSILAKSAGREAPCATVCLPRAQGQRPWLLDGISCTDAVRSLHSQAAALIIMTDLGRSPQPAHGVLRQAFGLTGTEAALANTLLGGISLREAAARLDISEGHARQRLQAIFRKTETTRQGELIALLARLVC